MLNKGEGEKESPKFEINFVVRDKTGKAIGGRKKLSSNSAKDLSEVFNKHTHRRAKGKGSKRSSGGNAS
tara:strand:- start:2611 stop:2817 length:207 start_codon:yes stop_codon:yes gene_type:complete